MGFSIPVYSTLPLAARLLDPCWGRNTRQEHEQKAISPTAAMTAGSTAGAQALSAAGAVLVMLVIAVKGVEKLCLHEWLALLKHQL